MPLKVADSAGSMFFSAIQNALYYAADNGADIISMSLGAAINSDPATDAAIDYAYNAGVTLLAATGNENASTISYPAIHQNVIGVGAASPCGDRKRSSSSRFEVNSGVNTDPNGYTCDGERFRLHDGDDQVDRQLDGCGRWESAEGRDSHLHERARSPRGSGSFSFVSKRWMRSLSFVSRPAPSLLDGVRWRSGPSPRRSYSQRRPYSRCPLLPRTPDSTPRATLRGSGVYATGPLRPR